MSFAPAAGATAASAASVRHVALVNIQYSSKPTFANSKLSNALPTLDGFLSEASGGQLDISGYDNPTADVYGPFFVKRYHLAYPSDRCNYQYWTDQAVSQAAAQGIDIGRPAAGHAPHYDSVVFVFPRSSCSAKGFSNGFAELGGGTISATRAWINGPTKLKVDTLGQQIGHNLGASSASRATGLAVQPSGDPFDIMGKGRTNQFSSFFKARMAVLGAMPPVGTTVINQAGSYTLMPNDSSQGGTQLLLIRRPVAGGGDGPYIALEARHAFGTFNSFPGNAGDAVTVRMVPSLNSVLDRDTMLLGSPLRAGGHYDDPESGISVFVNWVTSTGEAHITVTPASKLVPAPKPPTQLHAIGQTDGRVRLEWTPPVKKPNLQQWDYKVLADGKPLGSTPAGRAIDNFPKYNGTVMYTVVARDYWKNESAPIDIPVSDGQSAP